MPLVPHYASDLEEVKEISFRLGYRCAIADAIEKINSKSTDPLETINTLFALSLSVNVKQKIKENLKCDTL